MVPFNLITMKLGWPAIGKAGSEEGSVEQHSALGFSGLARRRFS
jgi:hypothetical protein